MKKSGFKAFVAVIGVFALLLALITAGCTTSSSTNGGGGGAVQENGNWNASRQADDNDVVGYSGTYTGTFTGDESGNITFVIGNEGSVFVYGDAGGTVFFGSGTVDAGGTFTGTTVASDDTTGTFDGNVSSGNMTGNWTQDAAAGTFTASIKATDPDLSVYAGTFVGTYTGDDSGNVALGVGNEGTIIGLFWDNAANSYGGLMTTLAADGTFTTTLYGNIESGSASGDVDATTASGTWAVTAK